MLKDENKMNISLKNLIGQCVYKNKDAEPWGRVKGVCFTEVGDKISSVSIETLSIIPLNTAVPIKEISDVGDKKLILQSEVSIGKGKDGLMDNQISGAVCKNGKCGKIKDMKFDFETGEITDVVIENGAFRKGEKICVNKMHIKDNTIYIE